jgi:hypothetical protein
MAVENCTENGINSKESKPKTVVKCFHKINDVGNYGDKQ